MKLLFKTALYCLTILTFTGLPLTAAEPTGAQDPSPALKLAPRLGMPFGDNAVLQQNMPVHVWGWSLPGAELAVTFEQQNKSAVAGADGRWQVTLDAMPADKLASVSEAPAGRTMTIVAKFGGKEAAKTLSNILIGDRKEHPKNKYDTGIRLARWALHNDYGQKDLVPGGPLNKGIKIEGKTIRILFDHARNGLMLASKDGTQPPVPTPDASMPWLSIQSKDGTWHWAEGKIDGSDLIVSCKDVGDPVAVRYAYTQYPIGCNLYNKDGLPASPFTSNGY